MHVVNSRHDLLSPEVAADIFSKATNLSYNVEQFVLAILKCQKLSGVILRRLFKANHLDNVRMSQQTQSLHLSHKLLLEPCLYGL